MQQLETPEIKRHPDGSIDIAHYMKIGRQERADHVRAFTKMAIPKRAILAMQFWSLWAEKT